MKDQRSHRYQEGKGHDLTKKQKPVQLRERTGFGEVRFSRIGSAPTADLQIGAKA